jgi:hypothetical protein
MSAWILAVDTDVVLWRNLHGAVSLFAHLDQEAR